MRLLFLDTFAVALLLVTSTAPSFALPQPEIESELVTRDNAALEEIIDARTAEFYSELAEVKDLWKRKGGGGGGGRGGGSSSSGSSSSGSSSSGSSSSGSSSSSSGSSSGGRSSSSSSSAGGSTRQGSGARPSFGGGKYYGGGATTPYRAGSSSPRGIAPVFLGVGALAIFPGLWLYGAYSYPYHNPYTYRNRSARRNSTNSTTTNDNKRDLLSLILRQELEGFNETKPVDCLCAQYAVCGCDDDGNTTFLDSVIGTGDWFQLNHSVVNVVDVNGTSTIVLNGTLPNGTTAAGGTEDANAAMRNVAQFGGYWVMVAIVACTVMFV